ncbi:hypothetical protein Tco_0045945 [Tanacetum coccineum]
MGLLIMDDGIVNWGEHTEAEETNHALMAISSSNEEDWNDMMERDTKGWFYSYYKDEMFVCGSLSHLIKDCDYYEKKMAREAEVKRVVSTGNRVAKPVWTNANRVNHANKFVPRSVQLNAGRPKFNSVRPKVNAVSPKVNAEHPLKNSDADGTVQILLKVPRHHILYVLEMIDTFSAKQNQANPHVGASEVTNSAGTPTSIASEEKDEEVELIVVPSAVKIPEEKDGSRTASYKFKLLMVDLIMMILPYVRALKSFNKPDSTGIFMRHLMYAKSCNVLTDCNSLLPDIECQVLLFLRIPYELPIGELTIFLRSNNVQNRKQREILHLLGQDPIDRFPLVLQRLLFSMICCQGIVKYLRANQTLDYWYPRNSPFDLEAFSDSDYGGSNSLTENSTYRVVVIFLDKGLSHGNVRNRHIVATSTI